MTVRSHRRRSLFWQVILMGMMLASSPFVLAQSANLAEPTAPTDPPEAKSWLRGITTNGYLSLSYTYNTNDPIPPINQFRVFDFADDEPQLDAAQVVIQHPVGESGQFGFRLNMIAGSAVPPVIASRGMHIARDFDIDRKS